MWFEIMGLVAEDAVVKDIKLCIVIESMALNMAFGSAVFVYVTAAMIKNKFLLGTSFLVFLDALSVGVTKALFETGLPYCESAGVVPEALHRWLI